MSKSVGVRCAVVGANHVVVGVVACISRIVRRGGGLLVGRRISICICSSVSNMLCVLLLGGGVLLLIW